MTLQDWTQAELSEIEEAGRTVGQELFDANVREVEAIGSPGIEDKDDYQEALFEALNQAEEGYRQFSPFEFFARDLNDREDADEAWEAYEEGIHEAWEEAWDNMRVPILEAKAWELVKDTLDEAHGVIKIGPYQYEAGMALQELDPIAFQQEVLAYLDREGLDIP